MRIYGIDFTSAPRPKKPIVCASATWARSSQSDVGTLAVERLHQFVSWGQFEQFLAAPGPWFAAVDFPLGQPRRLVKALDWPLKWQGYVRKVGTLSKTEFVETLDSYRHGQPVGEKHHLRATDRLAAACSPMMLYVVPVGKMFFEGAPRIERAGVCVLPCRPNKDTRIVVEGYPALLARQLVCKQKYKTDRSDESAARESVRRRMLRLLLANGGMAHGYPCIKLARGIKTRLLTDATGDSLDALLCAIQAARCYEQGAPLYGIPTDADPLEGWIAGCERPA